MTNKQTRKTAEKIKEDILFHLKKGPLSTKKISEILGSNWSTVNNYLEELKQNGEVKEIYSRENLKIYVRSDYPVFYGLPLDEDKLKHSIYLLAKIVERWNIKNKNPLAKTPLQKIAVDLIKKNNLDIPVVRFHYGKVLTTYFEPEKYNDVIKNYGEKKLNLSDKKIEEEIDKHCNIAWKEKKNQYEYEDMKIFKLSDQIFYKISNNKTKNIKKILELFNNILLELPTNEKYSYLFEKYHEFLIAVNFIFNSEEFNKEEDKEVFLNEILNTFNSWWQALTTEFFFEDIKNYINKDLKDVFEYIKNEKIRTYYIEIDEKLDNFLDYKKSLTPKEIKLDKDEEKMLNIMLEGANEE